MPLKVAALLDAIPDTKQPDGPRYPATACHHDASSSTWIGSLTLERALNYRPHHFFYLFRSQISFTPFFSLFFPYYHPAFPLLPKNIFFPPSLILLSPYYSIFYPFQYPKSFFPTPSIAFLSYFLASSISPNFLTQFPILMLPLSSFNSTSLLYSFLYFHLYYSDFTLLLSFSIFYPLRFPNFLSLTPPPSKVTS